VSPSASSRSRAGYALLLAAVAAYLLAVRLWNMNDTFLMLRDQIRDWRYALGPFSELPLTGTQSTAGGSSLGPIYYWILWLARHTIGPFTHNLPHTGAIGLAIVQTAADLFLLHAVRHRTGSLWTALGATLLTATAAHDLAVSSTIWNPSVSVAFSKAAMALLLLEDTVTTARMIAVTVAIWFSVQAHSAAIFIAAPMLAGYVLREVGSRRFAAALQRLRVMLEVILVLQLPFLYHALTQSSEATPTRALSGVTQALSDPATLRFADSANAVARLTANILFAPWVSPWWVAPVALALLVTTVRARRNLSLLTATVLPLVVTALGFALWQGRYDEYWYLPVAPCLAVTLALAVTWWRPERTGLALAAIVLMVQPWRIWHANQMYRMPEYGAMARGARQIYRQTKVVRKLDVTFRVPPFSDSWFAYEAMGGRIADDGAFDALIDEKGDVRFTPVPR
jgi:hypothetical protein